MLKCQICGYTHEFMIAPTHIKSHGLTMAEYKEKFPNAKLRIQLETSRNKISQNKIGKSNEKLKNRIFSNSHKENISKSLKEKFESGAITHWNLGKKTPENVKHKISNGNKNTNNLGNIQQHLNKVERIKLGALNFNCDIIEITDKTASAKCRKCNHIFKFTHQVFYPERLQLIGKLCPICQPRETFSSNGENELANFIKSIYNGNIINNDREQLGGKEIDIFIPELKLGIEYTGLYWHAEKQNPENKHLLWKQQFALKHNIKIITVFEDEWIMKKEIVKSRIMGLMGKHQDKIFARTCQIKQIDSKTKRDFLINNHIQGDDKPKISLGLFRNNELVSVMTFKMTNMVKGGDGNQWELSRFCSKLYYRVVGGASKLLKHFQDNFGNNIEIVSYSDKRWSSGNLYTTLGFKHVHDSNPSYWYTQDYKHRYHRSKFMKHLLVKHYPEFEGKTEWQIMQETGWDRIWDCGTSKWILK